MRLIGQEVDALAEHQLNEFAGERLLTGLALKCRSRPGAVGDGRTMQSLNIQTEPGVCYWRSACKLLTGMLVPA